jgi:hypothetical protein
MVKFTAEELRRIMDKDNIRNIGVLYYLAVFLTVIYAPQ